MDKFISPLFLGLGHQILILWSLINFLPKDDDDDDFGEEEEEEEQDEEPEEDEDEEEEEVAPKKSAKSPRRSTGTLRIKMPMIALRKSQRDRKAKVSGADWTFSLWFF